MSDTDEEFATLSDESSFYGILPLLFALTS